MDSCSVTQGILGYRFALKIRDSRTLLSLIEKHVQPGTMKSWKNRIHKPDIMVDHDFLQAAAKYLDCNNILIMLKLVLTIIQDRILVLKAGLNGQGGAEPAIHLGYLDAD